MLIIVVALGLVQADGSRCQPTNDLLINGAIIYQEKDEAELTGSIYNSSKKTDYENIYVKANFLGQGDEPVGEFTFTLKDEAEVGQSVPFTIEIADADKIKDVEFTIVCAETDRHWWPF